MSKPRTALLIAAAVALAFAGGWVARSMRSAQSAASPASRSVPAMESAQLEGVSGELREILMRPDPIQRAEGVASLLSRLGPESLGAVRTAPDGEAPPHLRGGLGDHVTGLATTSGVLAALVERERSGRGQVVETSLLRTGMYCLGWDLGLQMRFGKAAPSQPRTETSCAGADCHSSAKSRPIDAADALTGARPRG